ncbi:MAG TPA: hypothetical protein VEL77_07715 [Rugosimonospora sp.]|nr:hypothetical protein [Rugosimonospora sp.]
MEVFRVWTFFQPTPDYACVQCPKLGQLEQRSSRREVETACGDSDRDDIFGDMAASVEIHHTGCDPGQRADIAALIEHALADRPGDWKVSIIGSQANDRWEMKVAGPNAFERSYTLEGSAGQHEPQIIGKLVAMMVPGRNS